MDLGIAALLPLLPFAFLLLVALRRRSISEFQPNHEPPLPPSPRGLPVIGHIHHIVGKPTHQALRDLAAQHGPLVLVRVGQVDVVVVSSREAAEEVLKTQDANFADRPALAAAKVITYGCVDVAFSPYGSYWRHLRKICATELFSMKCVKSLASAREDAILRLLRDVSMTPPAVPINLSDKFMTVIGDIISAAVVGKRFEHQQNNLLLPLVKEALLSLSRFSFADSFPKLKFVDVVTGTSFRLNRIRREFEKITDGIIKQHQRKKAGGAGDVEEDLVDVLLRIKDQGDLSLHSIKAVIQDIFVGGIDTSSTTLEWAMSELMRNPETMKRAQEEVREAMRGKGKVEERDAEGLSYLKLVIKLTLRLHSPAPLLIPRVGRETSQVLGFKIPAGSRVVVNAWALGRDPTYWGDDAECFRPERFQGSPVDFKGANFEYIPFGAGRRMCPGVELLLAHLLFYFDWELPHAMKPGDLDMTENMGGTASRKSELFLLAAPRIPLPDVDISWS
ncbi:unnamed protein product [Musa acuminata subsp. malaccensis]|uniref:(wild Malaysian banana) hypothetical protein n=1 Tax=Musa acuminata subsp. malaccensis TaxID=214687 RepID=A0A8D7AD50_MUSAM|nr:unnamed protein product [Musa acuminata subsp. malaccensis]